MFWATGGGADPANDTVGTSGDQTSTGKFTVNIGGTSIAPLYAGAASGHPGLWQINFTHPATMSPNCFTTAQVSAGGSLSNRVIVPIAAAGQSVCAAPGVSPTTLSNLDTGGNITFGGLTIGKLTTYTNGVASTSDLHCGPFSRFSAAEWLLEFSGATVGPCNVLDETYAPSAASLLPSNGPAAGSTR